MHGFTSSTGGRRRRREPPQLYSTPTLNASSQILENSPPAHHPAQSPNIGEFTTRSPPAHHPAFQNIGEFTTRPPRAYWHQLNTRPKHLSERTHAVHTKPTLPTPFLIGSGADSLGGVLAHVTWHVRCTLFNLLAPKKLKSRPSICHESAITSAWLQRPGPDVHTPDSSGRDVRRR